MSANKTPKATWGKVKLFAAMFAATLSLCAGEAEEVNRIAQSTGWIGSEVEFRLWDQTRVDILTDEYAVEVDWSSKWAEAIGQSLYYAEVTNRKAGIILLVKDKTKEYRNIYRCQTICAKYDIRLWIEVASVSEN